MAYEVRISRRAERDLESIYSFITAATTPKAHAWYLGLRDLILSLETSPKRGAPYRSQPDLYKVTYGNKPHVYLILYSIHESSQVVNIVQVRHGARDG